MRNVRPRLLRPRIRGRSVAAGLVLVAIALVMTLGACGRRDEAERAATTAAGLQARSQALIDSGNTAYKAGDYSLAARRYASATLTKKDDPAAWFGLGMALQKLGRDEDARAAFAHARELAARARVSAPGDEPK